MNYLVINLIHCNTQRQDFTTLRRHQFYLLSRRSRDKQQSNPPGICFYMYVIGQRSTLPDDITFIEPVESDFFFCRSFLRQRLRRLRRL